MDLMPQGKSLNIGVKKLSVPQSAVKYDPSKLNTNEADERYQYLLKRAIIKRVENDDKIIFAELPGLPGVLVVYRKPIERNANPERLNLDRRELTQMPLLEGEERLRLLNYQHNFIIKIENLLSLPNLIFLDLYNNQIKEINSLNTVPTLRVLMLGKNLIEKIKNLNGLNKLDVLDLHSNKISKIENLAHLQELRVLNLANNQISVVESLEGLLSLTELNLRRNLIDNIKNIGSLSKLQRIFLSNNKLEKFENIEFLSHCTGLSELALDGNILQTHPNYIAWVINKCPQLVHLDLKKITSDMKESSKKPPAKNENISMPADNLISVITQEWKSEIERMESKGLNSFRRKKETVSECLVQSGHAEIEGDSSLFIYGNALEVITKPEFQDTVSDVFFQYLRFDYIVQNTVILKLKKFTNLTKLVFSDNNLHSFIQLSKLESLAGLQSIKIDNNDVVYTVLFRSFIVYRFPNLTEINAVKVNDADKTKARQQFQNFDRILCTGNILVFDI
jgi:leucine-rich repeat-containing protein 49